MTVMHFLNFSFLISNVNRFLLISNCVVSLGTESKGSGKQIINSTCFNRRFNRDLFKIFQIIELLNMRAINSKNYICVRHHVKNTYNLEIDQAMESNIKL